MIDLDQRVVKLATVTTVGISYNTMQACVFHRGRLIRDVTIADTRLKSCEGWRLWDVADFMGSRPEWMDGWLLG